MLCVGARCSRFCPRQKRGACAVRIIFRHFRASHFHSKAYSLCPVERVYPHATYTRERQGEPLVLTPTLPKNGDNATATVRWSSIQHPDRESELPPEAHPISIVVKAGQTLYLPAGWWHHVRQVGTTTIALNWWYDIEGQGMTWVWLNFLRGPGEAIPSGNEDEGIDHASS